jgi:ATP-dependent HslUV protease ATP-binding subunit HslU
VDGVNLAFSEDSIRAMAEISYALNQQENIGARRLRTVLDRVLEEINFFALEIGSTSGEV